jgi:hypothetical protein
MGPVRARQNLDVLRETADLREFLFGSERNNLAQVRPVLLDIEAGRCFYCKDVITGRAHVGPLCRMDPLSRRSGAQLRAG